VITIGQCFTVVGGEEGHNSSARLAYGSSESPLAGPWAVVDGRELDSPEALSEKLGLLAADRGGFSLFGVGCLGRLGLPVAGQVEQSVRHAGPLDVGVGGHATEVNAARRRSSLEDVEESSHDHLITN
jgi:hypothetical protein